MKVLLWLITRLCPGILEWSRISTFSRIYSVLNYPVDRMTNHFADLHVCPYTRYAEFLLEIEWDIHVSSLRNKNVWCEKYSIGSICIAFLLIVSIFVLCRWSFIISAKNSDKYNHHPTKNLTAESELRIVYKNNIQAGVLCFGQNMNCIVKEHESMSIAVMWTTESWSRPMRTSKHSNCSWDESIVLLLIFFFDKIICSILLPSLSPVIQGMIRRYTCECELVHYRRLSQIVDSYSMSFTRIHLPYILRLLYHPSNLLQSRVTLCIHYSTCRHTTVSSW